MTKKQMIHMVRRVAEYAQDDVARTEKHFPKDLDYAKGRAAASRDILYLLETYVLGSSTTI